ncbi:hypothetical protein [Actinoalloteichus caeruleus]|uniref:hypothetical protein n=1 Tax=Actinoalloteichus cyanogriseus TaxID=2893586 RepID=UPI003AACBC28
MTDTATTLPETVNRTVQDEEKADPLSWEGLSPEDVILASPTTTPMRQPDDAWAFLVSAVDVWDDDADAGGDLALFAGHWLFEQPKAAECEGDLVVVISAPDGASPQEDQVTVTMLLAHRNRWRRVGQWERLSSRWPQTIAATASAIMQLHTEASAGMARPCFG